MIRILLSIAIAYAFYVTAVLLRYWMKERRDDK